MEQRFPVGGLHFAHLKLLAQHLFLIKKEKYHHSTSQKCQRKHADKEKQENIYLAFHKPMVIKKYSKMLNKAWKAQMYIFKLLFTAKI